MSDLQTPVSAYLHCDAAGVWQAIDAPAPPHDLHSRNSLYLVARDGGLWFTQNETCAALGIDPAQAAALLGDADRASYAVVTAGGKESLALISEYGFHVLATLAGLAQGTPARTLHRWVTLSLLPAVRQAAQAEACPAAAEHILAELARRQLKEARRSLVAMSCARLLAHLWRHHADGQWLRARKLALSQILGVNPRSLGRALDCLLAWGFVERGPDGAEKPWPGRIRVNPAAVQAALDAHGLALPPEPAQGGED